MRERAHPNNWDGGMEGGRDDSATSSRVVTQGSSTHHAPSSPPDPDPTSLLPSFLPSFPSPARDLVLSGPIRSWSMCDAMRCDARHDASCHAGIEWETR